MERGTMTEEHKRAMAEGRRRYYRRKAVEVDTGRARLAEQMRAVAAKAREQAAEFEREAERVERAVGLIEAP